VVGLAATAGGAVPVAAIVALERLKTVVAVPNRAVIEPVMGTVAPAAMDAGTAVVISPAGIVTSAEMVASKEPPTIIAQLLMPIVSGAPALSVSVTTVGGALAQVKPASDTFTPLYELVEEVLETEWLDGVAVWLKLAVAVTTFPLSFRGSVPLCSSKVPVIV
jgi:hypothetical protein